MKKARIMVVEDEGLVALQIKEGLVSAGYEVPAIAASGKQALKLVADTEPDLVLMDIHLKGQMDGIQAATKIIEIYDIPVIYLTAYSDEATVERAKVTEPYGYILKPVSERSLQLAIEMTLQKARREKQLKNEASWYSSIVKGINLGIIVINLKGQVKFLNPFAEKMTGWIHKEVLNKNYKEVVFLLYPDSKEYVEIPFDDIILGDKIIKQKTCILRPREDAEFPVEYSIFPLRNQNNNTIGIILLFSYKDERRKSEMKDESGHKKGSPGQNTLFPPKGEVIRGIKVNWFHKQGTGSNGDSFNVFPLGNHHVGFFIFDVSWYGLTSTLFSHNLHQFLIPDSEMGGILTRIVPGGKEGIVSPLQVVRDLNTRFFFEGKDNPFFTMVYGIIQIPGGQTKIIRAGHPYPIFQQKNGKIKLIESEGGAVGMFADIEITEFEFEFEPGGRLFLYSDGLIDSTFADMNQDSFMRLIAFIEQNGEISLDQLILNLENAEKEWHKNLVHADEISFVVLERSD
ncbi:MAG: SpoIIE family protein phosphatase [Spirochaetales bacterium]|nr:SpoIIE family protein phosphatase [Spirochaetales bacterium]